MKNSHIQHILWFALSLMPFGSKTELFQQKSENPTSTVMLETVHMDAINTEMVDGKQNILFDHERHECRLSVSKESVYRFLHILQVHSFSFVFLNLQMTRGLDLTGSKTTIEDHVWIWTYPGKDGGLEFLSWPIHFGIWSVGILYSFVGGPIDVEIYNKSGNCSSLQVGDNMTDIAISVALTRLTDGLQNLKDVTTTKRFDKGYFCYKQRVMLQSAIAYNLCKYIFCPFETLQYSCRSYAYSSQHKQTLVDSAPSAFRHDSLWWVGPMVIAVLLFSFSPLLILFLAAKPCRKTNQNNTVLKEGYLFLDGTNHVTFSNLFLRPLAALCLNCQCYNRKIFVCLLPFLSLSLIGLQIGLDYRYIYASCVRSIEKGVQMGFQSMLAGFSSSACNFLPAFGGPYIACSCYVILACVLLIVPKSVSYTLESSILDRDRKSNNSPLCLSVGIKEVFGSVMIRGKHGFMKVYALLLSHFNCIINLKFWRFVFQLQYNRWREYNTETKSYLILPAFILLCTIEVTLCLLIYGNPILGFGVLIFQSYHNLLRQYTDPRLCRPLLWMSDTFLLLSILFVFFMFCNIFLDACMFISRMCIFTYTGVVVYPTEAYGYMILFLTVVYYMWEYSCTFAAYYNNLLRLTVDICETVQAENLDSDSLIVNISNCQGIKERLYYEIIDKYSPIRKRVLVSFVCLSVTIYILGMSVQLIMQRNEVFELHIIMHVVITIFLCAFPKILTSILNAGDNKLKQQQEHDDLRKVILFCLEEAEEDDAVIIN